MAANPQSQEELTDARILVADDDPRMLESLRGLLELYGYQIETALGGDAAIKKLSARQYDLLLLDLKMPDVSGHDVMAYMNSNAIETPTIVVSGETSIEDTTRALRQGAYDYLKKPYIPEELIATVKNAVRKRVLENSHKVMQTRLRRSEQLHRFIVNNSPDIIFILDNRGCFSFLNSKVKTLLAYQPNELLGRHITTLIGHDELEKANYFLQRAAKPGASDQVIELSLKTNLPGMGRRYFEISAWSVSDEQQQPDIGAHQQYRIYGTARDITERKEAEAFINFQAYHDLLTRLPNRSLFKDRLSVALTQAQRNRSQLAVMFIDLDRFKIINDSLGHTMGDRLLQAVSQRLNTCVRKGDTLSRFGGDEFTLLLPDIQDASAAEQVAEKILHSVKSPFELAGHNVYVGASIGIAIYPDAGEHMDALIKNADIAMYRVKNTGKDGYQLYDPQMNNAPTERLLLEQDMRKAIDNDEFDICYQPQVRASNQRIYGVEALIRWNHPSLGRLSPSEFISIAEDTRLIVEIDRITLRKACREILHYHQNGMPDLQLSVNLSPLMIERADFVENIFHILEQEQFPPDKLELEITEGILMNDRPDIIEKLVSISAHGISLAIDDFGTGYSSLSYLHKFPISTLKIDRSFISNINKANEEACIVNAIVSMAQGLKMVIVAEGVESIAQFDYLRDLGCDVVQGFLFGAANKLDQVSIQYNCDTLAVHDEAI